MARLIDADELKTAMDECIYSDRDRFSTGYAKSFIDNAPTVDAVPVCELKEILMRYFDIGDSYHFELTRVKEAFEVGTMGLDDFQEWTEEDVNDLVEYIKKNCADGERKGGDE